MSPRLGRAFFERDVVTVARELLGATLVHASADGVASGRIVETEAYRGPEDAAAHSHRGRRTARTEAMFGRAGTAYLFVVYGRNWAFNVVTGREQEPHAVLIRALEPLRGLELMQRRRGASAARALTAGPGRLCSALGLDRRQYGLDLCAPFAPLYLTAGEPPRRVGVSARIGVDYAGAWAARPWRFYDAESRCVSRK